jgi:hypothetical protein
MPPLVRERNASSALRLGASLTIIIDHFVTAVTSAEAALWHALSINAPGLPAK